MKNREFAIKTLEEKGEVIIRCNGNSMKPIISPKEAIHLKKVNPTQLRVGDAVFCKVKGALTVHKIGAIDKDRFRIENNSGFINGWVGANNIYGLVVQIENRVLVSNEELIKRQEPEKYNPFAREKLVRISKEDAEYLKGEPVPYRKNKNGS